MSYCAVLGNSAPELVKGSLVMLLLLRRILTRELFSTTVLPCAKSSITSKSSQRWRFRPQFGESKCLPPKRKNIENCDLYDKFRNGPAFCPSPVTANNNNCTRATPNNTQRRPAGLRKKNGDGWEISCECKCAARSRFQSVQFNPPLILRSLPSDL